MARGGTSSSPPGLESGPGWVCFPMQLGETSLRLGTILGFGLERGQQFLGRGCGRWR